MVEIDDSHLIALWEEFVEEYASQALSELENQYPTKRSLIIDYKDVQKFNSELAEYLIEHPDFAIPALEKVIKKPSAGVLANMPFEPHARVRGVPEKNLLIQDISSSHIDKLITIRGTITKRADVLHKVKVALYKCLMCEHVLRVPLTRKEAAPQICPECKRRSLKLDEDGSYFVDIQRAEVQELLERLKGGAPGARLELYMEDDLVNSIIPGQSVEITGIVRLRPPLKTKGKREEAAWVYTRYMEVNHIEFMSKDFEEVSISKEEEERIRALSKDPKIYDYIISAVAPGIYGHTEVKEALALQMFGGTKNKFLPGGEPIRDDIHILLIGDPGAAKSRLLHYAKDLVPKGIYVSGKSVTGVGLTAAAEKDELGEGGWTLKAGALVLASGGLAAVDEFDKIDEEDRAAMHEVMESQTVSIAKAGIVAQFKAKCAILAAANPKFGRFDKNKLPAEQFDIPPTLLSRFDLIFVIFDTLDKTKDAELASKILSDHQLVFKGEKNGEVPDPAESGPLPRSLLTKYIAYARRACNPVLSDEAAEKIRDYYVELRTKGQQSGTVPITARQIEGLVRLAEASARIRLSDKVEASDADRAISLHTFMMNEILRDTETGRFDVDIITTGRPKSQVDKINTVLSIVQQLQKSFDLVEINKVVEEAALHQISEADCRRYLDELIYKGELYRVKHGYVKLVEQYG